MSSFSILTIRSPFCNPPPASGEIDSTTIPSEISCERAPDAVQVRGYQETESGSETD
jgi:hypothetical protein